jgi:hypothetical protein
VLPAVAYMPGQSPEWLPPPPDGAVVDGAVVDGVVVDGVVVVVALELVVAA